MATPTGSSRGFWVSRLHVDQCQHATGASAVVPRQWAAGLRLETIAVNNHRQQSLSPPCRDSVYFRLMWKWRNQRRRRTQRSCLRFISTVWRRTQLLAVIIYMALLWILSYSTTVKLFYSSIYCMCSSVLWRKCDLLICLLVLASTTKPFEKNKGLRFIKRMNGIQIKLTRTHFGSNIHNGTQCLPSFKPTQKSTALHVKVVQLKAQHYIY